MGYWRDRALVIAKDSNNYAGINTYRFQLEPTTPLHCPRSCCSPKHAGSCRSPCWLTDFSGKSAPVVEQCQESHCMKVCLKVSLTELPPACLSKYFRHRSHQGCLRRDIRRLEFSTSIIHKHPYYIAMKFKKSRYYKMIAKIVVR